ncbi:hypothetical protein [Archaeoglobus neptunius]|uniref:hypothetical protein n=1 Tax=Archaeoglobus neptunius TaxID=2798580 RepID=UPI001927259C|nr:hypothetical protein [Archaeoglobus neptunius]
MNSKFFISRVFLLLISPLAYSAIRFALSPDFWVSYTADYPVHALSFFLSFFVLPFILMLQSGRSRIYTGKKQLITGILAYLAVAPVLVFLFGDALGPRGEGIELAKSILLVSLNVMAVDFYVFRVGMILSGNAALSILSGTSLWFVVHIPESLYLLNSGFQPASVLSFMLLSGIILSSVYYRTRDVLGLMTGHVTLNLILAAF